MLSKPRRMLKMPLSLSASLNAAGDSKYLALRYCSVKYCRSCVITTSSGSSTQRSRVLRKMYSLMWDSKNERSMSKRPPRSSTTFHKKPSTTTSRVCAFGLEIEASRALSRLYVSWQPACFDLSSPTKSSTSARHRRTRSGLFSGCCLMDFHSVALH